MTDPVIQNLQSRGTQISNDDDMERLEGAR